MQRWVTYVACMLTAMLLAVGFFFFPATERSTRPTDAAHPQSHSILVHYDDPTANLTVQDRCSWYLAPASGNTTTLGRVTTPASTANSTRCYWLTGFRRVLLSPLFLPVDTRLAYAQRETSARAFSHRRQGALNSLCSPVAATVTRPADGYLYALGCMVI